MFFHFKVNTKRERQSSNKKNPSNQSFGTLGALVTGLTSTPTIMSDEITQPAVDTLVEINNQQNGNHHHSPSKNFQVKTETLDEQSNISSPTHIDHGVDSGLSSEIEKSNGGGGGGGGEELSSISGVIIPEEKRVTDRVKVFEAVAKNGNNKKKSATSSSFSIGDHKQISPSSTESFDSQSINEMKTSKSKSKKSSLKKQIQNLLKIDKPLIQDDLTNVEEQINGKKTKKETSLLKQINPIEPLEIHIPSSSTVSKLVNSFQTNDIQSENVSYLIR